MAFSPSTTIAAVAAGAILLTGMGMLVGCGSSDYAAATTSQQATPR